MNFNDFKAKYENKKVLEFPNDVSQEPALSVLVQTYNHGRFIKQCLDAILSQETSFNFEILIGEDDSQDQTRKICQAYALKYPSRIRLFLHHRENNIMVEGHPTGNFNSIFNLFSAKGVLIAFCEGDDYWRDNQKLQKQYEQMMLNRENVLCFHRYQYTTEFDVPSNLTNRPEQPTKDLSRSELILNKAQPLLLTICFRNVIIDLPEECLQVLNVDTFILSLLGHYGKAKYIENIEPSSYRLQSGGSYSSKKRLQQLLMKLNTYNQLSKYYAREQDLLHSNHYYDKAKKIKKMVWLRRLKDFLLIR